MGWLLFVDCVDCFKLIALCWLMCWLFCIDGFVLTAFCWLLCVDFVDCFQRGNEVVGGAGELWESEGLVRLHQQVCNLYSYLPYTVTSLPSVLSLPSPPCCLPFRFPLLPWFSVLCLFPLFFSICSVCFLLPPFPCYLGSLFFPCYLGFLCYVCSLSFFHLFCLFPSSPFSLCYLGSLFFLCYLSYLSFFLKHGNYLSVRGFHMFSHSLERRRKKREKKNPLRGKEKRGLGEESDLVVLGMVSLTVCSLSLSLLHLFSLSSLLPWYMCVSGVSCVSVPSLLSVPSVTSVPVCILVFPASSATSLLSVPSVTAVHACFSVSCVHCRHAVKHVFWLDVTPHKQHS